MGRPWYPKYPADYTLDTRHLSLAEHGAYNLLLDLYYGNNGPISSDIGRLSKVIGGYTEPDRLAIENVVREFFYVDPDDPSVLRHNRCDTVIQESDGLHKKLSEAGRKGMEKRWGSGHNKVNNEAIASHNHNHNHIKDLTSPTAPTTLLTPPVVLPTKQTTPVTNTNTPKATRFKLDELGSAARATWFEFCRSERPDLDPVKTLDSFSDFWKARPGQAGLKLDWEATWRNWVRKEKPGMNGHSGQPTSKQMQGIMALERMKNGENPYTPGPVVRGRDIDGTATVVQPEPPRVSVG